MGAVGQVLAAALALVLGVAAGADAYQRHTNNWAVIVRAPLLKDGEAGGWWLTGAELASAGRHVALLEQLPARGERAVALPLGQAARHPRQPGAGGYRWITLQVMLTRRSRAADYPDAGRPDPMQRAQLLPRGGLQQPHAEDQPVRALLFAAVSRGGARTHVVVLASRYGKNVEVDYRGSEVSVANFITVLTGGVQQILM